MHNQKSDSTYSKQTCLYILDIIEEGVWDWHANTGQVDRSPGWYRMLGFDLQALPETVFTWEDIIHPDDYPGVMHHFEQYISGQSEAYEIEYRCRKLDGSYLWIKDQGRIIERNKDGSIARMIGAHLNIHDQKIAQMTLQRQNELLSEDKFTLEHLIEQRTQELEEANQRLENNIKQVEKLRNTDFLTAIYNRHKSETELERELARSNRYQSALSIALFDIDDFKQINDNHGHQIGDLALQKIAALVKQHIRETDILGRWGGDEFIIIIPGTGLEDALTSLEKIRQLIAQTTLIESVKLTCSFGVTEYIQDDSISSIYKRMDAALYRAKHAGRNSVRN